MGIEDENEEKLNGMGSTPHHQPSINAF